APRSDLLLDHVEAREFEIHGSGEMPETANFTGAASAHAHGAPLGLPCAAALAHQTADHQIDVPADERARIEILVMHRAGAERVLVHAHHNHREQQRVHHCGDVHRIELAAVDAALHDARDQ